jgi:uncharacterized repeat protein (TIGR04042 family)
MRLRWPDGQESNAYSPSTTIFQHLEPGRSYPMAEFLQRAESGLNAASERVKVVKGFYCSSAMDSLGGIRLLARQYPLEDARVLVIDIQEHGAGQVHYSGFGDI